MTKNQIVDLWKSIGWNSLEDYHNHLKSTCPHIILEELDPDRVNPKTFWTAADEHFGTDPVCNQVSFNSSRILDIQEANVQNSKLMYYTGMAGQTVGLVYTLYNTFGVVNIAEIGCGYNASAPLYLEIENKYFGNTTYTGFDIIRRLSSALEIEGEDGTFSDEQIKKYTEEFNLFFSSNTFQHLSRKQILSYLKGIYTMLPYGGYFNMMYVSDCEETYHYGQIIKIIPSHELIALAKDIGFNVVGVTTLEIPNSLKPFNLILKK
jgi:hypothetical protein